MRCKDVQLELSARMDGELRPLAAEDALHADTCVRCGAFREGAARVRTATRFEVAEPVPDLVSAVMTLVRAEPAARPAVPLRARTAPRSRRHRGLVPRLVAAALAGAVAGVAIVSGGVFTRAPSRQALATEIPRAIARTAPHIQAYSATFAIVERNWRPEVPVRRFSVEVRFGAPERLRVTVHDATAYPAGLTTKNDLSLSVEGGAWSLSGPQSCTPQTAPTCAPAPPIDRALKNRPPFDSDAPMPTDLILPVTSLAGADRVEVTGGGVILGREAVRVRLATGQAEPLFAFFQQAGSWRPLYAADPIDVWLDRTAWLPLRFEVRSAGGPDREAWSAENGIVTEPEGSIVMEGSITSLDLTAVGANDLPPPATNAPARDAGFRRASGDALRAAIGFEPVEPAYVAGLTPYRWGHLGARKEAVLSYASGLSWLRLHQSRTHREPAPFGGVSPLAERVILMNDGIAFYEPAGLRSGRRLAIHANGIDLYLETNLPRAELLAVAASLPLAGVDLPPAWRSHRGPGGSRIEILTLEDAVPAAGFRVMLPGFLPDGVRPVAAEIRTGAGPPGLTVFYRHPGFEIADFALRLHQSLERTLPPPSGTDAVQVMVRGGFGRWSAATHELEWIEGPGYRSITAPGLSLEFVLLVADSLRPA